MNSTNQQMTTNEQMFVYNLFNDLLIQIYNINKVITQ